MSERRYWVLVASRDHARRGLEGGFVMANHGKRAPLARMALGDAVLVYSPTTACPGGEPLRAVTSSARSPATSPSRAALIPGGFRRRAALREVEPIVRSPTSATTCRPSRLRFGFFELDAADGEAVLAVVAS